jgi:hypothetical protein
MTSRWRGRRAGPVVLGMALILLVPIAAFGGASREPTLVVHGSDGSVLARLPLPDGAFTLRYRNSVYRSTAEERFVVDGDGQIRLDGLAADELAVLEEYYVIGEPARRATRGRGWVARPQHPVVVERLTVAATDLGQRTLLVAGHEPLELWRLVEDTAPSVHLEVDVP